MVEKATVVTRYGKCVPGIYYRVVEYGYDYLRLRVDGKLYCVPKCLIAYD